MTTTLCWKSFAFILVLALPLQGCGVTSQDLRQEAQDEMSGTREKMSQAEKSYEKHEYLGLTSQDPDKWNSTDWSLWMDLQGGGR